MEVKVLGEFGYDFALDGIGLSYGVTDRDRLRKVAYHLADKDGGHNKFLESMVVWVELTMARYLWQEFDTYRVGTTKQSESTIHTITNRHLTQDDFAHEVPSEVINYINNLMDEYKKEGLSNLEKKKLFDLIKSNLPEGFLQKRIVCTNYKVLRNIINQRHNHKLQEWHKFVDELKEQLEYSDILFKGWE